MIIFSLQLLIGLGKPIFPCSNANKRPLTQHGFKDASLDLDLVSKWHQQHPDCAWGTPTSSAYGVVDIDPRNGGDASWKNLIAQHGERPITPTVETGSGGWHFYMRFPEGTRCGKLAEGIDLKADGGYVILPPSRILEPHHYQPYKFTVRPWDVDVAPAPEWIVELISAKPVKIVGKPSTPIAVVSGEVDIRTSRFTEGTTSSYFPFPSRNRPRARSLSGAGEGVGRSVGGTVYTLLRGLR